MVKLAANINDSHLTNIINNDFLRNLFSDSAKVTFLRPIIKKIIEQIQTNYTPVSLLNCFSKVYEKFLNKKRSHFVNHSLSLILCLLIENDTVPIMS